MIKAAVVTAFLATAAAQSLCAQKGDWTSYGNDWGSTRFSPLNQINTSNVTKLKPAWTFHQNPNFQTAPPVVPIPPGGPTVNIPMPSGRRAEAVPAAPLLRWRRFTRGQGRASASTPIVVDGIVYMSTMLNKVAALEGHTGKLLWEYTPPNGEGPSRRGIALWPGDATSGPRIVFGTTSGHLIALDAKTGKPANEFGDLGIVNMKIGVDNGFPNAFYGLSSPPVIYKNLIITGAVPQETPYLGMAGDTRAWNAHTGKLVWQFHNVARPGEVGGDSWGGDSWKGRSGTNTWGLMSIDTETGTLFMPIASASEDFWGGDRPGNNLFGTSIVALDVETGKLKWYFQTVHHDTWDYDVVPAPILMTVKRNGQTIPAVTQLTKSGYAYILDRRDGKPIYGVVETKVVPSDVPGEQSSPTQPIPVKPPPVAKNSFAGEADLSTVTPEHARACREKFEVEGGVKYGGPFTPFGFNKVTVTFPGSNGGVNWQGGSYNPDLGYMFVNPIEEGGFGKIVKAPADSPLKYLRTSPYGGQYDDFRDAEKGWPCQRPPWSKLIAIDVNTGDFAWSVPLGVVPELEAKGIKGTGASTTWGGTIATAGGLVFIGGTSDQTFRAFEAKTGKVLWEAKLPADGFATPITFQGKDGKQYVGIQATGGRVNGNPTADTFVVYGLQ